MGKGIIGKSGIKKVRENFENQKQTIFVEGPADKYFYQHFYRNAEFRTAGSCDQVISDVEACTATFGKTPLIIGIIDRDKLSDDDVRKLEEKNIFTPTERELESIFLNQEVLEKGFGKEFFEEFSDMICADVSKRTSETITDYNEALRIQKKLVSSKFSIRKLMQQLGLKNQGNDTNIAYLASRLKDTDAWDLIIDMVPKTYRI